MLCVFDTGSSLDMYHAFSCILDMLCILTNEMCISFQSRMNVRWDVFFGLDVDLASS